MCWDVLRIRDSSYDSMDSQSSITLQNVFITRKIENSSASGHGTDSVRTFDVQLVPVAGDRLFVPFSQEPLL